MAPTLSRKNVIGLVAIILTVLCLRMLVSVLLHPLRIGWDPALHLQCAQLITQGKIPYVDMLDVNPPLIWYLDTLPAFAATLLHQPVTLTFNLFLVLLMASSSLLCAWLLLKLPDRDKFAGLGAVFGLLYFNFFLGFDFGQREEIFVLLYMPFLLLRYIRYFGETPIPRRYAVFLGLYGSLGICLKHYFLLVAIIVELSMILARRKIHLFSPENISALAFALAYLGHFLLAPKAMQENYFGFLVPAFARGYFFWDTSLANSLASIDKRGVFFLSSLAMALSALLSRSSKLFIALLVFPLVSIVPYLMQFKGWTYHDIPVFAGACIALCAAIGQVVSRFMPAARHALLVPLVGTLLGGYALVNALIEFQTVKAERQFPLATVGYSGTSPWSDIDSPFTALLLQYTRPGDSAIFISNGVSPGYPLLTQFNLAPGSRHLHCCILSVLEYIRSECKHSPEGDRLIAREEEVANQYGSDIASRKPAIIFLQKLPVETYLNRYDFVSRYLGDYKQVAEVANFAVYVRRK